MTAKRFFLFAKAFNLRQNGMLSVLFRASCHLLGMLASMLVSEMWLGDTYTANLCLFAVFTVTFELLWGLSHRGPRLWFYVACVLGFSLSALMMVNQAASVRRGHQSNMIRDERINSMLSNVPGVCFATNEQGIIRAVNPGLLQLTGYQSHELVGKKLSMLFPAEHGENRFRTSLDDAMRMREAGDPGWRLRVEQGIPLKCADGSVVRVTIYLFGLRHSVYDRFDNDVHFISLAVNPE